MKRSKPEALNACLMLLVIVAQATLATFLPAMPAVANELNVSASAVDRTLTFYMAGYAVSMALTGALTTRVDLRRVQLGALIVHVLASFAVVLAPSINFLAGARVVQALGAGVATVLARIYVQELFSEERQLAALTRLSTAIALTPALSPLIAGMLLEVFSWRLVLLGVGVLGAGTLLLAQQVLPASASGSGDGERGLRQAISSCRYWWFTAGDLPSVVRVLQLHYLLQPRAAGQPRTDARAIRAALLAGRGGLRNREHYRAQARREA